MEGLNEGRFALLALLLLAPLAATAETSFRVESAAGVIALEVQDGGATMRLRLARPADLDISVRALESLLAQAFPQHAFPAERVSLGVGRILEHPWLSQQLAAAALHSPHWDAALGKPRTGNDNAAVMRILDDGRLLAGWAPVFARYGATIRSASVEKVLVGRIGDTDELAPLATDPAAAGKRLPFDAILWLQLERTNP